MRTYILRRLLLLIPTLFGISLINFAIINAAPAPRSSRMGEAGEFDQSRSVEANEGEFIFRQTFNLDKPTFLNTRFLLEDGEIFWLLTTPLRPWELPADKRAHQGTLDDYGRTIVPHLLRIAEAMADPAAKAGYIARDLRPDYERRWEDARAEWMRPGKPPGEIEWPPPQAPPPFLEEFHRRAVRLALDRLANNAPRRPIVVYGEDATPEIERFNADVRDERVRLRSIYAGRASDAEKVALWRRWREERASEWEYGFGRKVSILLLDTRFAKFWKSLLTGDLGTSFLHRRKVWDLILERLRISLTLSFGSLILAYLISVPLGILSTVTHRSIPDRFASISLFALYSLPTMFLGVLLREYLSVDAGMFPVKGFEGPEYARLTLLGKLGDNVWHVVLPIATLTVGSLAYYSRYMKAGLLEIIRADFVRTARAKGLSEFVVVMKHAVRNGLIPIITLLGSSLPALIGGSVVIEFIFGIDGMGRLGYEAVVKRDYAIIMGINVLAAALTMIGVFLGDILYAVVDPRISYK